MQCCYTPWLQGGFTEGGIDFFENSNLGECGNEFRIKKNESIPIMGMLFEKYISLTSLLYFHNFR